MRAAVDALSGNHEVRHPRRHFAEDRCRFDESGPRAAVAALTAILSPDNEALSRYRRVVHMAEDRILPPQQCGRGLVDIASKGSLLIAVHGRREFGGHRKAIISGQAIRLGLAPPGVEARGIREAREPGRRVED